MLINSALLARKVDLNDFTAQLAVCTMRTARTVQLRNGMEIRVRFQEEGPGVDPMFYTEDWNYVWNADGSSCKNSDLDIIGF